MGLVALGRTRAACDSNLKAAGLAALGSLLLRSIIWLRYLAGLAARGPIGEFFADDDSLQRSGRSREAHREKWKAFGTAVVWLALGRSETIEFVWDALSSIVAAAPPKGEEVISSPDESFRTTVVESKGDKVSSFGESFRSAAAPLKGDEVISSGVSFRSTVALSKGDKVSSLGAVVLMVMVSLDGLASCASSFNVQLVREDRGGNIVPPVGRDSTHRWADELKRPRTRLQRRAI